MERYQSVFSIVSNACIGGLFREGLLTDEDTSIMACWKDLVPLMDDTDELGGFQLLELRSSLPDELLMYADKISMAHGLEIRVPYLDHKIVEYVERLKSSFKVRLGVRKWLHRRVARRFLPAEIIWRRKKGFACNVVDEWFRSSLSRKMEDIFFDSGSFMYQYLRPEPVQQIMNEHKAGAADNHKLLFSLIVLEEFLRTYSSAQTVPISEEMLSPEPPIVV
jgi:asparagine synthase (glutamine-hydrolysing)